MKKPIADRLSELSKEGAGLSVSAYLRPWGQKVAAFLRTALGEDFASEFLSFQHPDDWSKHAARLGYLEGLVAKGESESAEVSGAIAVTTTLSPGIVADSKKVFIVHGHDNEAKESTARFLDRLGLEPIILHEQASSGQTIIEKFEKHSNDIQFAVVLLTPDDVGGVATSPNALQPRARQNVIMELGYFLGKLGRSRVCALHKGGVELPSDYQGVVYIPIDTAGAWRTRLAQEFVQAKLRIDLGALLAS